MVFFLGWIAHTIYGSVSSENPYFLDLGIAKIASDTNQNQTHVQETQSHKTISDLFIETKAPEMPSPADRIKENQIHVLNNRVIIDIQDPEWASFTDTNSMVPVFDYGHNAIEIIPKSSDELHVGDIVSYHSLYADGVIIHRIIKIGEDENGWYATLKGDNNPNVDPGKIRFSQIERVLVAIIY